MIHLRWRHPEALACATGAVRRLVPDPAHPTQEQTAQLDFVEPRAHEAMRLNTADGRAPEERQAFTMMPVGLRMRLHERA